MFGRKGGNSSPLGSSISQVFKNQLKSQQQSAHGNVNMDGQEPIVINKHDESMVAYGREQLLRTREVFWYYGVPRDQLTEQVFATLVTRGKEPESVLDELRALFLKEIDAVSQYYQESLRAGRLPPHSPHPNDNELSQYSDEELLNLLLYNIDPCWLERFYCPQLLHGDMHHDQEVAQIMRSRNPVNSTAFGSRLNVNGQATPTSPLLANAGSSQRPIGNISTTSTHFQFEDMEVRNILSQGITLQDMLLNREMNQTEQGGNDVSAQSEVDDVERAVQSEILLLFDRDGFVSEDDDDMSVQSECRYLHDTRRIRSLPFAFLGTQQSLKRKLISHASLGRYRQPIANFNMDLPAELVGKLKKWFQLTEAYSGRSRTVGKSLRKLLFWEMGEVDDLGFNLRKRRRIRLWKFIKKLFLFKQNPTKATGQRGNMVCLVACATPALQHKYSSSFDSVDRDRNATI